jgi:hypothetical protein
MAWFFTRRSSSSHSHKPGYARSNSSYSSHSHRGSSSYYKRRPRDGYIKRLIYKFKHLLRELWYYLRRNPIKVFFFVIMPLVSGGALAAFAKQLGVKLPDVLSGKGAKQMGNSYGGYYGSKGYGGGAGLEDIAGGMMGSMSGGSVGTLLNIAKTFL